MSGFLAAVGVLLPFADPDLGHPSRTAGPGFPGAV